jgi:hypothetical protein
VIEFTQHPRIAMRKSQFDPALHDTWYAADYSAVFARIGQQPAATKQAYAKSVLRDLILNDLFFIVFFLFEIPILNHPFIVKMCRMVETGPQTGTLDVWARGHGKAVDVNEPVLTTEGWSTHGELQPGVSVFSPDGDPVKVIAKTEVFTDTDCYRVRFSNNYSVVVSGDHLWTVDLPSRTRINGTNTRKKWHAPTTINTRELMAQVDHSQGIYSRPFPTVQITKPLQFEKKELLIDPYVLGVWLGDGASDGVRITSSVDDSYVMEKMLRDTGIIVRRTGHSNSVSLSLGSGIQNKKGSSDFRDSLRKYKLFKNKHIPQCYLTSSFNDRLSLLEGLMDTDGSVHKEHSQAVFCNTNLQLISDVFELCQGLGLNPTVRIWTGNYKGERRPFMQVQYRAFSELPTFRMPRKRIIPKAGFGLRRVNKIISVEPVDSIPVSCIQVDSTDGMYLIGRSFIPTHNSTIITMAETLQFHLKYPEKCTAILSYARPAAKKILIGLKILCEKSSMLINCFPDVMWQNPTQEATKWGEDGGLVFRRKSMSRGESTIEAWGLTEGMPTGRHFERLVFDDIETEDIANSPAVLNDVFSKFDMAGNLSTLQDTDIIRVIGTYYNHAGPVKRIGDLKLEDGTPIYKLRVIPASDNGQRDGNPVYEGPKTWEKSKASRHFNSQKLCNPTPEGDMLLDYAMMQPIEPEFLPPGRFKFLLIDQAGGTDTNIGKGQGDLWSIGVVSIVPAATARGDLTEDDLGISDVYLEDLIADQMTHSEAIDAIVRMYLRNGMIMQLGVEKVGLATTEIHIADALRAKGRKLSVDHGNLVLLRPGGRSLEERVKAALQWPLNNSKLWYSTGISPVYRDKMLDEMRNFPVYHCDILNMLSYSYDMFVDFKFEQHRPRVVKTVSQIMAAGSIRNEWGR